MKKVLFVIYLLCSSLSIFSLIINVPADQPTIQAGLDIAAEGDTILVQAGIYYENLGWPATIGLKLFGINAEECIIDGNSSGSVIRMGSGSRIAEIDGFTIQNGNADGDGQYAQGGGIYCHQDTLQLSNLIITNNSATESGGGVFCRFSELNLSQVSFNNNFSHIDEWCEGGGGMFCWQSALSLEYVNFENNSAVSSGGGLFCKSSSLNILYSEFNSNSSFYEPGITNQFGGGGMFCYSGSSVVEHVTFSNNTANSNGGGFGLNISDLVMRNVFVRNNSALDSGGGIYLNQSTSELTNLLLTGNSTDGSGGGISISSTTGNYPLITNATIADNSSTGGGGIFTMLGGPRLTNCILWNNEPEEICGIDHFNGPPEIAITYSDIEGGEAGINFENGTIYWLPGNIESDPLFLNSGDNPYSLSNNSPCIDAGTLTFLSGYQLPDLDILGNSRIYGDLVDMGAYEWQGVGVEEETTHLSPLTSQLSNYPNPFNPSTTISFSLTTEITEITEISFYNLKGQKVKTLPLSPSPDHPNSIIWDGTDQNDQSVSSGVYFYGSF